VVGTGAGSVDSTIRAYCIRLTANHNTLHLTQVKRKILGTQVAQMRSQVGVTPPATEKEPVTGEKSRLHSLPQSANSNLWPDSQHLSIFSAQPPDDFPFGLSVLTVTGGGALLIFCVVS
jgi:hypothetical protein